MVTKQALIQWIPKDQGGWSKPPLGEGTPPYATVVRFLDEPWPHETGSWSLVVVKDQSLSTESRWVADVHFLARDAPHEALREGRDFELYEGGKRVALGRITESADHLQRAGKPVPARNHMD